MEKHTLDIKSSIIELIENLIIRTEQINFEISNDININDRLVYLVDDLTVLSNGFDALDIKVDREELNFILNNIASNLENEEQYLLGGILTMELQPLLIDWREMIGNE